PWQIIEVKSGRSVAFDDWITEIAQKDVIFLGEEHYNQWHIEAALKILRALLARDRRPVLALEMFGWDGQAGLDQYLSDSNASRDQFLQASHWEQNWGGAFADYEPLITFARDRHLPVLALNPPRSLVRRVATQGLTRAKDDVEMDRWGMRDEIFFDDHAYRDVILKQLRLCHSGLPEDAYQRMYEASLFRDEGMAKVISNYLSRVSLNPDQKIGPLLSYTGGGHIQYQLPVPNRVQRKRNGSVQQVTVYLTALDPAHPQEVQNLLQESIADYTWVTPIGINGPPKRCR
ncbi:MAG: hypothetical protein C4293_05120, partial [Nitrospiraceae bacterium]